MGARHHILCLRSDIRPVTINQIKVAETVVEWVVNTKIGIKHIKSAISITEVEERKQLGEHCIAKIIENVMVEAVLSAIEKIVSVQLENNQPLLKNK